MTASPTKGVRAALLSSAVPALFVASLTLLTVLLAGVGSPGLTLPAGGPVGRAGDEGLARGPRATVSAYTIDAELEPLRHTIHATGTIDFTNVSRAPLDHLFVHLYIEGFASDRTVFHRGRGRAFRGGGWRGEGRTIVTRFGVPAWGDEDLWPKSATTPDDPEDGTDIRVPLPRAIAPGESVRIALAFETRLPPIALRTGYAGSFHMAGQWFPKLAKLEADGTFAHFPFERLAEFYADFSDWDVTVRAPSAFLVGATGAELETVTTGDTTAHRFVQRGVHDFAFAAWDGFLELREEHRGVRLRCLYPPGHEAAAKLQLEVARRGLDHLGARLGPYPFEDLTLVHPPQVAAEAGGMEYPTLITTGGPWWGPLSGARTTELVTIHELAHQWFQGIVASNEREHPFLDEGLTTFAESEAMGSLAARGSSLSLALGLPLETLSYYRARGVEPASRLPIAQPARAFVDGGDYGALVYGRTAVLLATLDRVHGGGMTRALGAYARRFRFAHPEPDDLLEVVRAELGADAAEVLRLGLFERGTFDVSLRGVTTRAAPSGGFDVELSLEREGKIELPVEIALVDAEGATQRLLWDGRATAVVLSAHTASAPRFVQLDPERKLLLDDDLQNGAWAARPAPAVAGRTLGVTAAFVRALASLATP